MAAEKKETEMEYRLLGGTGLKVSVLSFGFWATFGVKEGLDRAVSILKMCRNAGINLFDNAEAYGNKNGDAEIIMGKAIKILQNEDKDKWRRSDLVITTKIFWGGDGQNEKGLSYKHIMEAMNGCLERLQLNYVDVVFAHRPDELTPTEEIVRAFTNIINSGKAFYWGTSEWSAQQITEAYWVAKENKLIPPVVEQPQYNLFHRDMVEREYRRLYSAPYRLGTTIWSPLASGVLTGKYNKGIPEGTRMDTKGYEWLKKRWETDQENKIKQIEKLTEYAKDKFNTSVGTLAIAWCAKNPNVSCVLLGATKEEQLEENLQALNVARKLTAEHMEEIDKLLQNKPMDVNYFGRELKKTF